MSQNKLHQLEGSEGAATNGVTCPVDWVDGDVMFVLRTPCLLFEYSLYVFLFGPKVRVIQIVINSDPKKRTFDD